MRASEQHKAGLGRWAIAGMIGAVALAGCEDILDVNLPSAVTESAFSSPASAALQVNSVLATFECAYSAFSFRAAGYEDNWQRLSGVAGTYSEYDTAPAAGECDSGAAYSSPWIDPLLISRAEGNKAYERISNWSDAEVPNRQRLLAQAAFYTAASLDIFGEFFCETAVDAGPFMTYSQTLNLAEEWANKALGHINTAGDFGITLARGTVTTSAANMTKGLRARIKWANGDLAGAAADAAEIPSGFHAYVLREPGVDRRNTNAAFQGGAQQAAGFLQGPVRLKTDAVSYGISELGNNPVTGQPWPNIIPFTGYINLAIDAATGRAVTDDGYPLTTETAGTVGDSRVTHRLEAGSTSVFLTNKFRDFADDIPLINWREMRLIQAQHQNEVANNQAAAIALINELRTSASLPIIQGAYATGATQASVKTMIIEERRRALWLEGRFWATKILNPDILWFPRSTGSWVNTASQYTLAGGVRLLMRQAEYDINPNLSRADRGTGCPAAQAPVFN